MRAWVPVSATTAPVALIGGWTLAQLRQPSPYDARRDTISALAGSGATDAWIMTAGLGALGLCHLATASGLTEAGRPARVVLALGGAATLGVAALPQPHAGHLPAAAAAFAALAAWPALVPGPARRACLATSAVLLVTLSWLVVEVVADGELLGLSERVAAGAESLGPLLVAFSLHRSLRRSLHRSAGLRTGG